MRQEDMFVNEPVFDMAQYRGKRCTQEEDAVIAEALRILEERLLNRREESGTRLTTAWEVADFLKLKLAAKKQEVFAAFFLDSRNRVIAYEEMFKGTVNRASVYPREVVRRALELNAVAVIIAHNHPSGFTEPSRADQQLTERIKNALDMMDIQLFDHFVVGEGRAVSFAERGLL